LYRETVISWLIYGTSAGGVLDIMEKYSIQVDLHRGRVKALTVMLAFTWVVLLSLIACNVIFWQAGRLGTCSPVSSSIANNTAAVSIW